MKNMKAFIYIGVTWAVITGVLVAVHIPDNNLNECNKDEECQNMIRGDDNIIDDDQQPMSYFSLPKDLRHAISEYSERLFVNTKYNQDTRLNTVQIIRRHGYPAETHIIETEDGYLLGIHRIPHGRSQNQSDSNKRPVFLQHGVLTSSADWVMAGPNISLGFLLADKGYDVWLGNIRGNTYSRGHIKYSMRQKHFWDFSFHEMGLYDIPAVINFILLKTGQECVSYIGHSMGTTMFYAMISLRPELNEKIAGHISLAPIAYVSRMTSIVRYLSPISSELEVLFKYFTNGEILPHSPLINTALILTCDPYIVHPGFCHYIMGLLFGSDPVQMKKSVLSAFMGHNPAGVSYKVLVHYGQLIKSRKFRQYDYGKNNKDRYNAMEPPDYNISALTTKVALFYSSNDALSIEEDVKEFYSQLPNPIGLFKVNYSTFNHLDFIIAKDARPLLYEDLLDVLAAFDSGDELDVTNRKSVIYQNL